MANANFRVKHGLEVSGSVGIGTTNLTRELTVQGTAHINKTATWHDPHLELFVENNTDDVFVSATGDGFYPSLDFYSVSSTQGGGSSGVELFRAFTSEQLSNGDYKTGIKLRDNNVLVFGTSSNSFIQYSNNTNALELKTLDAKPITVDTNDTERLRITSDGNIGIGSTQPTAKLDVNGGLNVSGILSLSATNMSTGISTITGPATIHIDPTTIGDDTGSVRIKGDLYVDGTNFVVDSETITLADHVVGIASTATTDALTDGAGIGIGSDKTFTYDNTNTSLKSSENLNLASGKTYKIDGSDVLSGTTLGSGVTDSSLTSVGTLGSLTVSGDASFTGTGSSVTFSGNASLAGAGKSFSVGVGTDKMFFTVEGGANGGKGFIAHEQELFLSVEDGVKITNFAGNVWSAHFVPGAEVNLYYNNSKKFETTNTGATVTGTLTATSFSGDGSALTNISASVPANLTATTLNVSGVTTAANFRTNSTTGDGSDVGFAIKYYVTANGASHYRFAGPGLLNTSDDPTIYVHRGFTYIFENSTGGSHPFRIQFTGTTTGVGTYASGSQSGTQVFTIPMDAPASYEYQCTFHSGMKGTLSVV